MTLPQLPMGYGSPESPVMVVGEFWATDDVNFGRVFGGSQGRALSRMLSEAGFHDSECYITAAVNAPAPRDMEEWFPVTKRGIKSTSKQIHGRWCGPMAQAGFDSLQREIALIRPQLIIALGTYGLWATTGAWGIAKWRGSILTHPSGAVVIPTYSPGLLRAQAELQADALVDLRRARQEFLSPTPHPEWKFLVRPGFRQTLDTLQSLIAQADALPDGEELWLELDLETRAGHIACCGLSWSLTDAISIPFMCVEDLEGYWSPLEEGAIIHHIYRLTTHPRVAVRWQNGLYDAQYIYRHWHFIPRGRQDTMISQHTLWAGRRKALDYQASLYCRHYVYWKDDGKTWTKDVGEDQLWGYNAQDCVRTREVGEAELSLIKQLGLEEVEAFQQKLFYSVLRAMNRGVRIDAKARAGMANELHNEISKREGYFSAILGHPLNPRSPLQMQKLFYTDLGLPIQWKRGKPGEPSRPTLDDAALQKLCFKEPIIRPLVKAIQEYRSLGVFLSTFVMAPLDFDGRMRCSYNIAGTETYRFSSAENAFGSGTNLQNIPKGTKAKDPDELSLPNIRTLFIPDPGFTFFDMDLDRADLQVVVWEAEDEDLKLVLRRGIDMHLFNACAIFGIRGIPPEELIETHPNYPEHRARISEGRRQLAKAGCHAVNYYCQATTLSQHLGSTRHEAQKFIDSWLGAHPGIKRWHERTEKQLRTHRYVENRFGYRRYYFEHLDGLLPEALAWVPQSTVANVINRAWVNIDEQVPEAQILLQVHDSLAGQIPTYAVAPVTRKIKEVSAITIPYPDPLIIPVGIKLSDKSWGDVK